MKKLIAILLSVVIFSAPVCANAWRTDMFKSGDVNLDGEVTITDATEIQKYIAGMDYMHSESFLTLADTNQDGNVNIMDVTLIQKALAKLDTIPNDAKPDETESSQPQTEAPSSEPVTVNPTDEPSSEAPTAEPSAEVPTEIPTEAPTPEPQTEAPTETPATEPSTEAPTEPPTEAPATEPQTETPTEAPTEAPVTEPPTEEPSTAPETEPVTSAPVQTEETAPNPKVNSKITIFFTNNENWSTVNFYFFNSETNNQKKAWPGEQIKTYKTNGLGEKIYYTTIDTSVYNRVIFNNGTSQTVNVPIGKASSGFYISDSSSSKAMKVGTYAYKGADSGTMKKLTLPYPSGYNKKIWIWTPADYSATSAEKYRTVYIMDGQNLFDDDHSDLFGGWEVTDAVESMMSNGGRGVIIVGIDNGNSYRDSELTPDLGEVVDKYKTEFSKRTGKQFADFVADTVMPYVQKNYNSSKAACDNCIAGSSSGGIEAFYIGMEHKDKFGQIGALSPAFLLFGNNVWENYLSGFSFGEDMPRLYIYNGNSGFETELCKSAVAMYNRLTSKNWPSGKIKLVIEENADHNEAWWRIIFPDALSWCLDI